MPHLKPCHAVPHRKTVPRRVTPQNHATRRHSTAVLRRADETHHIPFLEVRVYFAPQLAEVGQRRYAHPVDEALVCFGGALQFAAHSAHGSSASGVASSSAHLGVPLHSL